MEHDHEFADAPQVRRNPRFSKLPEPIRLEDTTEERPATQHDTAGGAYNPDWWLIRMGGL
ncbi:hypothetical protein ABZ368_16080 [Streptomyces sp. NPDC005908]|uniref:hypothetical protein n=1 Tax=unclassified Streptomyces TaxID=2593676 RepID=UPI0011ABBC83|nr:hypothetical protein [Streptomyces sp. T12]TWD17456.1 hypothetical protein FB570_11169 [Streptomyces sp. T12]